MKIGIITNHADRTLESDLQTWAIHKTLDAYGQFPYIIHYHPFYGTIQEKEMTQGFFQKKVRKSSVIAEPSAFISTHVNLLGNSQTLEELKQEDFRLDTYISILDKEYNQYGQEDDAYCLTFVKGKAKKMMYGWDLNGEKVKSDVTQIDSLSVQKGNENIFTKQVPVVQDPLIWIKQKDIEEIKDSVINKQPFLFVDIEQLEESLLDYANQLSKQKRLAIKQIKKEKRSDVTYYLGLATRSDGIVTDSIIGVLVAILYEKPFVYIKNGNHEKRILSLLTQLELLYHVEHDWKRKPDDEVFLVREKKGLLTWKMNKIRVKSLSDFEDMLHITDKNDHVACPIDITKGQCYGCFACEAICKEHAIEMKVDKEGFVYPKVEEKLCTNCKECQAVCLRFGNRSVKEEGYPLIYAAINKEDSIRMKSTSGGVFPALCKETIEQRKGVVVGSRYDRKMKVVTGIADTMEEVEQFYGVKYSKTELQGIFVQVKRLLDNGTYVLYSGLPCECAGLRAYLKKDYDNLLIQELLCRSTASPKVFHKYIKYLEKRFGSQVTNFVCRDKKNGWGTYKYDLLIQFKNGKEKRTKGRKNDYIRAYNNFYLNRPSCSQCQFIKEYRVGDITVGDFLGGAEVYPELFQDRKGVSLLMLNTEKGKRFFECVKEQFVLQETTMKIAFQKNHKQVAPYRNERTELLNRMDQESINSLLLSYNDLKK